MTMWWKKTGLILLAAALTGGTFACESKQEVTAEDDDGEQKKRKKKKKKKKRGKGEGDGKRRATPKMTVTGKLGGKDVAFKHAIVADSGTSARWIHLAESEMSCDKMSTSSVRAANGTGVAMQLAPWVQPDGKLKWVVKSANYVTSDKKRGRKVDADKAKVNKVEGKTDEQVVADIDFTIEAKDGEPLALAGTIVAKGCGTKNVWSAGNEPNPQKNVTVSISGRKFDIAGAKFTEEKNGDMVLSLTTNPTKCDTYTPAGDFGIDLKLDEDKKSFRHAWFRGDMMASNYNASDRNLGSIAIGEAKDGKVAIKVDYEKKSFDFLVSVKGDVSALKCVEKK